MFGKLKGHETIAEGLERAPKAINMFFKGGNIGKLVVKH
jgi:NADPH-dependent curcumin reductase CurA